MIAAGWTPPAALEGLEKRSLQVVSCPSCCTGADTVYNALPIVIAQGIRLVEMALYKPSFFDHTDPDQIDRLIYHLERASLNVNSVHAPFGLEKDISSFDNKVHEVGVDAVIEAIEVARLLGAGYVVVHASDRGVTALDHKKRLDRARGVMRELAVLAEEAGVNLALENLPPGFLCSTPEEMITLIDSISSPCVGVCLDTGHANLTGQFEKWARTVLPRAFGMHLHDNDGQSDQHLFPGMGNIDWKNFARIYLGSETLAPAALECNLLRDRSIPDYLANLFGCLVPKV
jgi:sugar phosphate isomerase/epimerase